MFRLIRTTAWTATRRRLLETEGELEAAVTILTAQGAGWEAPRPPVDGDLADVLRHVDAGVRDEAVCRAADYAETHLDPTHALGLAMPERWTGYPDGSAVHYLGAGWWLHHHPGHTALRTARAVRGPGYAQTVLLHSGTPQPEQVMSLAALLEMLHHHSRAAQLITVHRPAPRAGQPA